MAFTNDILFVSTKYIFNTKIRALGFKKKTDSCVREALQIFSTVCTLSKNEVLLVNNVPMEPSL